MTGATATVFAGALHPAFLAEVEAADRAASPAGATDAGRREVSLGG
jgi:hypothetical protein